MLVSAVSGVWACDGNGQFACELSDCGNRSLRFAVLSGNLMPGQAVSSALGLPSSGAATATVTLTTNSTTTSLSAPGQTSALNPTSCSTSKGTVAAVGAGVGIPLLLGVLAALTFLVRERRRFKAIVPASTKSWAPFTTEISTQGKIHQRQNAQELSISRPICEIDSQTAASPANH
jgi:hypothetical protein